MKGMHYAYEKDEKDTCSIQKSKQGSTYSVTILLQPKTHAIEEITG